MSKALVIGKFMNFHAGHEALIKHAQSVADDVLVLICAADTDLTDALIRRDWIFKTFGSDISTDILYQADEGLPIEEGSDREISEVWAKWVDENHPDVDVLVGSEEYINYMAEYGSFRAEIFDMERNEFKCSSTSVREGDGDFGAREYTINTSNNITLLYTDKWESSIFPSIDFPGFKLVGYHNEDGVTYEFDQKDIYSDMTHCTNFVYASSHHADMLAIRAVNHEISVRNRSVLQYMYSMASRFGESSPLLTEMFKQEANMCGRNVYVLIKPAPGHSLSRYNYMKSILDSQLADYKIVSQCNLDDTVKELIKEMKC